MNFLNYNFKEQTDKWVEIGCPLMVLCVLLFLIVPSFFIMGSGLRDTSGSNSTLQIALNIIPFQLVFIVPLLFAASFSSTHISLSKKLGLLRWNFFYIIEAIIWELILIVPLTVLAGVIYFICLRLGYNFTSPVIDILSKANKYGTGLVFVFAVFIAPVIEEIAFRRVLFVFMTKMFGAFFSAVLTSLVFACMHGGVIQVLPLFILGMVLQHLYLKHGTLFPSILLHTCHNLTIMVLYLTYTACGL